MGFDTAGDQASMALQLSRTSGGLDLIEKFGMTI